MPLRRYVNIVPAIAEAADDEAVRLRASRATRPARSRARRAPGRVPGGRHEPRRPHEARRRAPGRCSSTCALPADGIEDLPGGGLRIGAPSATATSPPTCACASATPPFAQALLAGASGQLRNMATVGGNLLQRTALRVLPRRDQAVQQARAGQRLPAPATATTATTRSSATRGLRRDAPVRHGGGAGGARRDGLVTGPTASGRSRSRRAAPAARRRARARHGARARRADHRGRAAGAADRRALGYRKVRDRASYAFAVVSVAVALERRGRQVRDCRIAFGASRTGPGAPSGGGGAARRARRPRTPSPPPPTPSWPPPSRCATTPSRCRSRATATCCVSTSRRWHRDRSRPARRRRRRSPASRAARRSRAGPLRLRAPRRGLAYAGSSSRRSPRARCAASTRRRRLARDGVLAVLWHGERAARSATPASRARAAPVARSLPRPDRRRWSWPRRSRRARGRRRSCGSTTTSDEHDVTLRADHPSSTRPRRSTRRSRPRPAGRPRRRARAAAASSTRRTRRPAYHNNPMEPHADVAVWERRG